MFVFKSNIPTASARKWKRNIERTKDICLVETCSIKLVFSLHFWKLWSVIIDWLISNCWTIGYILQSINFSFLFVWPIAWPPPRPPPSMRLVFMCDPRVCSGSFCMNHAGKHQMPCLMFVFVMFYQWPTHRAGMNVFRSPYLSFTLCLWSLANGIV